MQLSNRARCFKAGKAYFGCCFLKNYVDTRSKRTVIKTIKQTITKAKQDKKLAGEN